jgi:hypothetical protein
MENIGPDGQKISNHEIIALDRPQVCLSRKTAPHHQMTLASCVNLPWAEPDSPWCQFIINRIRGMHLLVPRKWYGKERRI